MPLEKVVEKFRGKKDRVSEGISLGEEPGVTDEMPVLPHKVLYADLPFYSDPECKNEVSDGRLLILQPLDPDGFDYVDVVPTRRRYRPGQYLTWQLNKEKQWEDCYYRNPDTGAIERAWTLHVEFVGKIISSEAVAGDRKRIEELEAQCDALRESKSGYKN